MSKGRWHYEKTSGTRAHNPHFQQAQPNFEIINLVKEQAQLGNIRTTSIGRPRAKYTGKNYVFTNAETAILLQQKGIEAITMTDAVRDLAEQDAAYDLSLYPIMIEKSALAKAMGGRNQCDAVCSRDMKSAPAGDLPLHPTFYNR